MKISQIIFLKRGQLQKIDLSASVSPSLAETSRVVFSDVYLLAASYHESQFDAMKRHSIDK